MKADIERPEVKDIAVAVVKEKNKEEEWVWNVYLLNMRQQDISGVLVSSQGYGELNGRKKETSVLRHFLDEMKAQSFQKIEPIIEDVFGLFNQYWVSFYEEGKMYDKKYIFVPESIHEDNFTEVPLLNKRGVMIR